MILRDGATAASAQEALRIAHTEVPNAFNAAIGNTMRDSYLEHVDKLESRLGNVLERPSISGLLHTPRYWHIAAASATVNDDPTALRISNAAVSQEIEALRSRLESAHDQFARLAAWLARPGLLTLIDTNILMHCQPPNQIDWSTELKTHGVTRDCPPRLVVPLAVVDELDRKKFEGADTQRRKAQAAIRALRALRHGVGPDEPALFDAAGGSRASLEIPRDDVGRTRLPATDDELIAFGQFVARAGNRPAVLVTRDYGAEVRAARAGLKPVWLDEKYRKDQDAH